MIKKGKNQKIWLISYIIKKIYKIIEKHMTPLINSNHKNVKKK